MTNRIIEGDALEWLRDLDAGSVQTTITSPPFWGLRDYGNDGQLGLEPTPDEYVRNLVAVFREVRRVLRDDGTLWLNLGDSYAAGGSGPPSGSSTLRGNGHVGGGPQRKRLGSVTRVAPDLKPKDLVGIPWLVAFALRADGWYLRSDIIWNKPNPMPESVTDRPTKSHEYLFLLTKSPRYYYDADAIRETDSGRSSGNGFVRDYRLSYPNDDGTNRGNEDEWLPGGGRNKRSVWTVATQPFPGAHFATFPPKLIEPCVLAGTPPKCCGECGAPWERVVEIERVPTNTPGKGGRQNIEAQGAQPGIAASSCFRTGLVPRTHTLGWRSTCDHADDTGRALVLDPFCGAGTTGVVALRHDRDFVGVELNPEYARMARNRIYDDGPLLNVEVP